MPGHGPFSPSPQPTTPHPQLHKSLSLLPSGRSATIRNPCPAFGHGHIDHGCRRRQGRNVIKEIGLRFARSAPPERSPVLELLKALGASTASRAAAMLVALSLNAILARTLTPSEFAFLGVLISIAAIAIVWLQFGYQVSIVRIASEASYSGDMSRLQNSLLAGTLIIFITAVFTLVPMTLLGAQFLPQINSSHPTLVTLFCSALFILTLALNVFYAEALRGIGLVGSASTLTGLGQHGGVARGALLLIFSVVLIYTNAVKIQWVLIGGSIASLLVSLYMATILWGHFPSYASLTAALSSLRQDMRLNLHTMGGQLLQLLASQHSMMVIAGALLTGTPLAWLVAAQQLRNILTAPVTIFNGASPKLLISAHRRGDKRELQDLLRLGSSAAFLFISLTSVAFILFGKEIFTALFGDQYSEASYYFLILIPGLLFFSFGGTAARALMLLGYERQFMLFSMASATITISTNVWAASAYGAAGLAAAASAAMAVQNLVLVVVAKHYLSVNCTPYLLPTRYLTLAKHLRRKI